MYNCDMCGSINCKGSCYRPAVDPKDSRIAELEAENARLTVALHKAESRLMAHEYVDAAPEGHPIKRLMQQKPTGVAAYPKHRGENHLRRELDSYTVAGADDK